MAVREHSMGFMMGDMHRHVSPKSRDQSETPAVPDDMRTASPRKRVATSLEDMDHRLLEAIISDLELSVAKG